MATRLRILAADDWLGTAAVDGRNLYYNTQFFNAMNNKEIEFVVAHEILHMVFDHIGRREDRDPMIYNISADYIVNNTLVRDRIGVIPSIVSCYQDFKYEGWTSEDVYDELFKQAKKNATTKNKLIFFVNTPIVRTIAPTIMCLYQPFGSYAHLSNIHIVSFF